MERLHIQNIEALQGYRLRLTLSDGRTVERDVSALVPAPGIENVFSPWRDPAYFAQVQLDSWPAPVWPNGVDLDPDVLIYDGPPPWATPSETIAAAREQLRAIEVRHEEMLREIEARTKGTS